jgi:uncharacterized membrane protein
MEFILLVVLVVAIAILWSRTQGLQGRLTDLHLASQIIEARLSLLEANARDRVMAERPAVLTDRVPAPPAPAPAPATAPSAPTAPSVARASRVTTRPAAAPLAALRAAPPEPAGPGLAHRTLVRLGVAPAADGESVSRAAIEAWLEGRMLAIVGGIALVLGAIFFLSLAFSRGWITEPMRVLFGLGAGVALLALGEVAFSKVNGILGHVLVAVGLAVVSLALFAGTRLYDLVPVEWAMAGALLAAVAAAAIAVRHDSELVAAFGLIAVLAAPPTLGAEPTLLTMLFLATALVGTTGVALFRTWLWLPPLAFVLTVPQLTSYLLDSPPVPTALVVVAAFWAVNVIAAGGEEFRHATDRLRTTTVTLLLASAAFTLWAGFAVLDGPDEVWRGTFVAALAVGYLALGLFFLARNGDRHPFGLVVAATGVAALTMAVPVQFGGPPVPIAWAAEAVALTWVAVVRRHPYTAAIAVVLGILALAHLLGIEYPAPQLGSGFARTWPFVGAEGMTFLFTAGALIVAGIAVPVAWIRAGLAIVGGLVTMYVLPFELSGTALVVGWAALAVAGAAAWSRLVAERLSPGFTERRGHALALPAWLDEPVCALIEATSSLVRPVFAWAVGLPMLATIGHLALFDFPVDRFGQRVLSAFPYGGPEGLALGAVLAALAASGWLVGRRSIRLGAAGIGLALLVYTVRFEIGLPEVLVAWAILAVGAVAVVRRLTVVEPISAGRTDVVSIVAERLPFAAATLALLALIVQALSYADVGGLVRHVGGTAALDGTPFLDVRAFALLVLAATFVTAGWTWRGMTARLVGGIAAGAVIAWLLPFEVRPGYAVAGWSALALVGAAVVRRLPSARDLAGVPALALLAIGALVTVAVVAPPTRLVVDASTTVLGWPILTDATVAVGALALALAIGATIVRADPFSRTALVAAGAVVVYGLSVGLVDVFQREVAARPLGDLQKEAQVGLSVLWSVLGGVAFAVGLRAHRTLVRLSGLALLGLATVKVFLVDLAALDVAYRVLSLVALGVLLLVSALVHAQMQRPNPPAGRHA